MDKSTTDILQCLRVHTSIDFTGLRPAMAARRIGVRMRARGIESMEDYRALLEIDPEERSQLMHTLTIKISTFYRYPIAWEYLRLKTLPELMETCANRPLRVWSAGCSTGEEAYTFLMLYNDLAEKKKHKAGVSFFATDIDQVALDFARAGIYANNDRFDLLPLKLFREGFVEEGHAWRVNERLRRQVAFSPHDLLSTTNWAPPDSLFGEFDLILCRNVLIFYRNPQYNRILEHLTLALRCGGFLMLGEAGRLPVGERRYLECDQFSHIYKKREL